MAGHVPVDRSCAYHLSSMYICADVCAGVQACVCICVEARGWWLNVFLYQFFCTLVLEIGFFTEPMRCN